MTDKPPAPEFGPNGAVLNSATMTPRLRHEIEAIKPTSGLWWMLLVVVLLTAGWFFVEWKPSLLDRFSAEEKAFWSGWIAGATGIVYAGNVALAFRLAVAEYELRVAPTERRLELPQAMRWVFVIVDTSVVAPWGFMLLYWLPPPSTASEFRQGLLALVFLGIVVTSGMQRVLRGYASKRGWTWRPV